MIPDGSLVMGSPGRVVRSLSAEEIESVRKTADHYVAEWKMYREKGIGVYHV